MFEGHLIYFKHLIRYFILVILFNIHKIPKSKKEKIKAQRD